MYDSSEDPKKIISSTFKAFKCLQQEAARVADLLAIRDKEIHVFEVCFSWIKAESTTQLKELGHLCRGWILVSPREGVDRLPLPPANPWPEGQSSLLCFSPESHLLQRWVSPRNLCCKKTRRFSCNFPTVVSPSCKMWTRSSAMISPHASEETAACHLGRQFAKGWRLSFPPSDEGTATRTAAHGRALHGYLHGLHYTKQFTRLLPSVSALSQSFSWLSKASPRTELIG